MVYDPAGLPAPSFTFRGSLQFWLEILLVATTTNVSSNLAATLLRVNAPDEGKSVDLCGRFGKDVRQ